MSDLVRLARGERVTALLSTASLATGGREVYGDEVIVAAFRRQPLDLTAATVVADDRGIALFAGGEAVVADLYDGHVARLWRVGAAPSSIRERRIDVPFDPDLAQARGGVVFDRVGLAQADADALAAAVAALQAADDAFRVRAFVIRTMTDTSGIAALVAVYRASPDGIGFTYAAVQVGRDGATLVAADPPAARAWSPRL